MKSFADRNPYLIGLVSVLVIGAATAFAFMVGILHLLERSYTVKAVFDDAAGVRAGDDVRMAGVKAGRVGGVHADRRAGKVTLDLVVHNGVDLGPQTHAEIALLTLLGTRYVRLAGPVVRPYLADTPKAQRVIPADRTKTPFDVFELTRIGTRTVQETDTAKLNQLVTDLADITEGKHDQIRDLVTGVAKVSAALHERDTQLRELLDRADALSGTLAQKDQTLVGLIDQSQGILDLVQRRRGDIARGLDSTASAVGRLAGIVSDSKANLDAILSTLHPTLALVAKHQDSVDRALGWFGPGALGLSNAGSHGPWADIYVRALGPDFFCALKRLRDPAALC